MKRIINKIVNLFGYEVKKDSYLKINIIAFTNDSWCKTMQNQGRLYDYLGR